MITSMSQKHVHHIYSLKHVSINGAHTYMSVYVYESSFYFVIFLSLCYAEYCYSDDSDDNDADTCGDDSKK